MPASLPALVAIGIFVLAAAWIFILARALSKKSAADYFFFGNNPPKDPD
jgi:hypothetical protein